MRELEQQLKTFFLRGFTRVQTSKPVKSGNDFGKKDFLVPLPKSAPVFTRAIPVKCFSQVKCNVKCRRTFNIQNSGLVAKGLFKLYNIQARVVQQALVWGHPEGLGEGTE